MVVITQLEACDINFGPTLYNASDTVWSLSPQRPNAPASFEHLNSLPRFRSPEQTSDEALLAAPVPHVLHSMLNGVQKGQIFWKDKPREQAGQIKHDPDRSELKLSPTQGPPFIPITPTPTPSPFRSLPSTPIRTPRNPSPTYKLQQRLPNEHKRRKAKRPAKAIVRLPLKSSKIRKAESSTHLSWKRSVHSSGNTHGMVTRSISRRLCQISKLPEKATE